MSRLLAAAGARLLRASMFVDWMFGRYTQGRAFLVTSLASDDVLDAYNDLTYGATTVYDASAPDFRTHLFNWEADMVARVFPPPPARVLIGGAGGGREAFELAARGYQVTAFEPSTVLAASMADRAAAAGAPVEVLLGRYQDLPILRRFGTGEQVDLTAQRFDAAMLGWSSYSHIRHRQARIATLQRFAAVTDGPVVASFFLRPATLGSRHWLGRLANRLELRSNGDSFTPHIGFFHLSSEDELTREIAEAGLELVAASYNASDGYWPWVAVARRQDAALTAVPA